MSSLPAAVEHMIQNGQFRCMVVDYGLAWVLGVAKKAGMRTATLWPSCAAVMAAGLDLPELIADGMLDKDGLPTGKQIPPVGDLQMKLAPLVWNAAGTEEAQKQLFRCLNNILKALGQGTVDLLLCNTAKELEEGILSLHRSILPIGPLPTGLRQGKPVGNFWAEDYSCLSWLDAQPDRSVVYVAFGSIAVLDEEQFHVLARGLELSGRPFLWVVRPGLANTANFPDGFLETVEKTGKVVTWSPQHRVLAHPAVACFVSHCGWNSVMEGVRNGLPFLTWPYFADQFINESYICDVWKTGLRLVKDATGGLVTSEHIAARIENLLNDPATVSRALELQKVASRSIGNDGTSFNNLTAVIKAMKG
ncbi:UDP-glycosyltransferase 83A1-like [Miscanthus floridulus]|uniref:UDP-glycosyltransferase 83A1-like n=1 Tax=Miscanthus floridulus TaxID=154761 RepID=UPI003457883D